MCGRYTLRTPGSASVDHFGLRAIDLPEVVVRRFNVAPIQQVLRVRQELPISPSIASALL